MNQPDNQLSQTDITDVLDPVFQRQVARLHQLTIYGRWIFAGVLWLTVGSLSLWGLRYPISLIMDYFTWSAVRYGLMFDRVPAFGLFLCLGFTSAILVWHARNWLFGLPKRDRHRLEQQVYRIRKQGPGHPLWKWVCRSGEQQIL
ncbi:MAG: hypothetical protein HC866_03550 [Leptolyngbyaceae cyanobacterium RU_5_1]|nr:hypothetical protein [Leptolyngbyaceae cyanobacterium RU_5_1]